jgi:DNA sulfur modification protein DndC
MRALDQLGDAALDPELTQQITRSFESLATIADANHDRWVVTYSGGKDSTTVAILTSLFLVANPNYKVKLEVIYSDTLMEMPPLRDTADAMMKHMRLAFARAHLEARVRVVTPPVGERFWVKMLGRGYPPPGPHFRWCTRRLKIAPADSLLESDGHSDNAILTGVRYGESASRDRSLKLGCATGGECGQDYWYAKGPTGSDRAYYAPIVSWRTCKVWDFLVFVAPTLGWPTDRLFALYGSQDLRFGCWTCSLVRRDRTMEDLMRRPGMESLTELHAFRNDMIARCKDPANRLRRPDGKLGPVRLGARRGLLRDLLSMQERLGASLIAREEVAAIRREWKKRTWRNENALFSSGKKRSVKE